MKLDIDSMNVSDGIPLDNPQGVVFPPFSIAQDAPPRAGVWLHTDVVSNAPPNLDGLFGVPVQNPKPKE